ncbi:MAG: NADH-quinone oxidoreductase subunit J [Acidobacteria bacterium]|nr:MAG: NADH-quinone oxidoreductase subunit J [Acidobacteriota bacterium]
MQMTLFLIFAALALAGAINLLVQRHPIYSALSLVTVMGALAVEYLILGAEFIAFIQVIVYAGAIMVLFVFVIMVLNAGEVQRESKSKVAALMGIPVLILFAIVLLVRVSTDFAGRNLGFGTYIVQTGPIGESLFHDFLLPFEVTSVLFLVGVLGAVVLAARQEKRAPAAVSAEPEEKEEAAGVAAGK